MAATRNSRARVASLWCWEGMLYTTRGSLKLMETQAFGEDFHVLLQGVRQNVGKQPCRATFGSSPIGCS